MSLAAAVHHAGVVGVGVSGRPSSRASSQRSKGTITSSYSMSGVASGRRSSAAQGSRGVLVPASRAGAARAAAILLISCHLAPAASASVPAASDLQAPPPTGSSRTGKSPLLPEPADTDVVRIPHGNHITLAVLPCCLFRGPSAFPSSPAIFLSSLILSSISFSLCFILFEHKVKTLYPF